MRQRQRLGLKSVPTVYALKLDGINSYIQVIGNPTIDDLSTVTIYSTLNTYTFALGNTCAKGHRSIDFNSSDWRYIQGFSILDGSWHFNNTPIINQKQHITVTYNDSNVANIPLFYVNGVSQGIDFSQTPIGVVNTDVGSSLFIGTNGLNFTGLMYQFAYFNVILTPTQISNLVSGQNIPTDFAGCVLYHDYTKGNALDLSGNGNNGLLKGNAFFEPQSQFQ